MVLVLDKPRQVLEHIGTLDTWSNKKNLSTLALVIVIPGNGKPIPVYLMISTWKIHQFSRDFFSRSTWQWTAKPETIRISDS
jgi:hypothetical protein